MPTKTPKKPRKGHMVKVIWQDACLNEQVTDHTEASTSRAISYGVLLQNTKKQIKVALTLWSTGENDILVIPKSWVKDIIILKVDK